MMLKRLGVIFAVLVLGVIAILFLLPLALPTQTIKNQIETAITDSSGWTVRLRGDVSISIFPSIRLVADDIDISPPSHDPVLSAETARFSLGLSSLLGGSISIDEIFVGNANLVIQQDANGSPVWLEQSPSPETNAVRTPEDEGSLIQTVIQTLSVQKLSLENTNITLIPHEGAPTKIENLTVEASLPAYHGPLFFKTSAILLGKPLQANGEISAFNELLENNTARLTLSGSYQSLELALNGAFQSEKSSLFDGAIALKTSDFSKVIDDSSLKPGAVDIGGGLHVSDKMVRLTLENSHFYEIPVGTSLTVQTDQEKPLINGSVTIGDVDVDRILAATTTPSKPDTSTESAAADQSTEPDLSFLTSVGSNISFSVASLKAANQTMSNMKGSVAINNGVGTLTIDTLQTVGGTTTASLTIDANSQPATMIGTLKANDLAVESLLSIAGQPNQTPRVTGHLSTDLAFGFRGLTLQSILASGNARGEITFDEGQVDNLGLADAFSNPDADSARNISTTISFDGITNPVRIAGNGHWLGDTIRLNANTTLDKLLIGQKSAARVNIQTSTVNAGYEGGITLAGPQDGRLNIKGRSARALAKWLGTDLPPGNGYGSFELETDFVLPANQIALSNLAFALDDMKGRGNANVTLDTVPAIKAAIEFERLNVDPYIGGSAGTGGSTAPASSSTGWSTEPIDFSFAKSAKLDLTASVSTLIVQDIKAGPLSLTAKMENGVLDARLTRMGLYNGNGSASILLNAADATSELTTRLAVQNVNAYPFLKDVAAFERIEGNLALNVDLTTRGNSEAALVSALNGSVNFNFTDGAIRGINIAKSMRALTSGSFSGWNSASTEKTDFSEFLASFQIENGVARNDDLRLVGPLVRVTGAGTVLLPQQSLKYRVDPKLVASLQGQGGQADLKGFGVPIIVEGPWANPKIYPDIKGFLQNPEAGLQALKSLGGGFADIASGEIGGLATALNKGNPQNAATAGVGSLIQNKIDVDVGDLVKDGKIDKEAGVATALNVVGGLLGGNRQHQQEAPTQPAITAPVASNIPVPRPNPQDRTVVRQQTQPAPTSLQQTLNPNQQQNEETTAPSSAEQLIQNGLRDLFGRARN